MEPQVLQALLKERAKVCVSFYMPIFRWGREVQQNEIRFRNLVKDAEKLLDNDPVATPHDKKIIVQKLEAFLADDTQAAWQHPPAGLALFVTPDSLISHTMGRAVQEQVHVGERFYLRPLLPALHGDGQFVLLAVSQKQVRLFEGNNEGLEERFPDDLPTNLKDALNIDDYIESIQNFSYSTVNSDYGMFHGQGAGNDDQKANLLQFFHRLDEPLNHYMEGRDDPLLFAGVEYLYPIFKEATSYPHLLPDSVHGNFDDVPGKKLHAAAREIVERHFRQVTEKALGMYEDAFGQDRATADLETILKAAQIGAVENLLIREEAACCWGQIDAEGHVHLDESPEEESLDLIDEAAVQTLKQGGDVFVVREDQFPAQRSAVAARLRFELAAVAR